MNENKQEIKYILYCRKSTESEDKQVQSIEDQTNKGKELAESKGLPIVEILTETKSAKNPDQRPMFNKMIQMIKSGKANGILTWAINRLSRNPLEYGLIHQMLQDGVIKSIWTHTGEHKPGDNVLIFYMLGGMANHDTQQTSEGTKRGLTSKAEKGWFPSVAPIGYLNNKLKDKGEKDIAVDADRFPIIRKMWDLMLTGKYSVSQILEIANENWGLRTVKRRSVGGKKLSINGLYGIFSNIFYTGTKFIWNGSEYEGKHEPMITLEEFDKVQELLGRKGKPRKVRKHKSTYNNLMSCGECSRGVTGDKKVKVLSTGETAEYILYRCNRKSSDHNYKCSQRKYINEKELERQVEQEIGKFILRPEFREWAEEAVGESDKKDFEVRINILSSLNKALEDVEEQLHELIQMRYKKSINDEQFKAEIEPLKKEKEKLRGQLREAEKRSDDQQENVEKGFNFATYGRIWFNEGDYQTKRDILFSLGSNLTLKDGKVHFNVPTWLEPLVEKYPPLEEEYRKLELAYSQGKLTETQKKEAFASLKLKWLPGEGSNLRPIGYYLTSIS